MTNSLIQDQRIDIILSHIRSSDKVIDVGCAHHDANRSLNPYWLHQHLVRKASKTVGVELEPKECEKLRRFGYNVICADIESPDLNKSVDGDVDVVVAGEIIEHLSNPGLFLQNVNNMLKRDGKLIITTPNPWNFYNMLSSVLRGRVPIHEQHTAWFDEVTIKQLISRYRYKLERFEYLHWMVGQKGQWISKLLYKLNFQRLAGAGMLLIYTKS